MIGEVERRTTVQEATVEYRDTGNGEKKAVISGYAAVFNSESRNLGGFVETIHPEAFDEVLATAPDVIGVFNHDRNLLLGRTGNGSMRLMKDPYGLRYEITPNENTSIGRDVVQWVKDRTVVGSSFAFAVKRDGGDSWSTDGQRGIRRREVRAVGLLEDVGPVVRPAYDSSSVVVSRRAIEMALGETFRPIRLVERRGEPAGDRNGPRRDVSASADDGERRETRPEAGPEARRRRLSAHLHRRTARQPRNRQPGGGFLPRRRVRAVRGGEIDRLVGLAGVDRVATGRRRRRGALDFSPGGFRARRRQANGRAEGRHRLCRATEGAGSRGRGARCEPQANGRHGCGRPPRP
ncbi:MAG: HK97 family phage prohead protease [Proteobacteria bacterium]|nr:HK97 family phage prohead protease [Pseudomonadota bacterium]